MRLLDRYILRNFLQIYLYCIAGFISIWLIFDISDNISTFLDEHVPLWRVLDYYLTQVPEILVILLPVSLLLALLFCLGRMSRANEIVSMLTAGVSVPRVLLPLIIMGVLTSLGSAALNYSLAPHAELARRVFTESTHSRRQEKGVTGQIFRNRSDNRTWFIQQFRPGENVFNNVQILQQDNHDNITRSYLVTQAVYRPETKAWDFKMLKVVDYDAPGNIKSERILNSLLITNWSETPFRLASANFHAESLSLPELRDYLRFNSDFPVTLLAPFATHLQYRIALPWACLVVVFIATPLGIGFSRRGILASVATAILLVFAMNFLTHLFLALGEGDRVPPWSAAWIPNIIFAVIGLYLLYLRASNREAPRFHLGRTRPIVSQ
ncbi:MAG: LptF/LptG family permease [Verrucomicrobiota bacterium]|nr:LptF/LptG family permease [Verrucomicrobiota bacterium]